MIEAVAVVVTFVCVVEYCIWHNYIWCAVIVIEQKTSLYRFVFTKGLQFTIGKNEYHLKIYHQAVYVNYINCLSPCEPFREILFIYLTIQLWNLGFFCFILLTPSNYYFSIILKVLQACDYFIFQSIFVFEGFLLNLNFCPVKWVTRSWH